MAIDALALYDAAWRAKQLLDRERAKVFAAGKSAWTWDVHDKLKKISWLSERLSTRAQHLAVIELLQYAGVPHPSIHDAIVSGYVFEMFGNRPHGMTWGWNVHVADDEDRDVIVVYDRNQHVIARRTITPVACGCIITC